MKTVRQLGEFRLIRELAKDFPLPPRSVRVGVGDDCAVLRTSDPGKYLLYTCDPVVEGVHFLPTTSAYRVGWKAMARNLSDIAAMGGLPRWAVVSLAVRPNTSVAYVKRLYTGLRAAATRFGCAIVGGDTTHVKHEPFIVVTLIGEVEKANLILRSGARPGDIVWVTGTLGGSRQGRHLSFIPRVTEARWLVGHFGIHSMIDLSDGLSNDLRRLIEANGSRISFEIQPSRVPIARTAHGNLQAALNDGEDFELLFTTSPKDTNALQQQWNRNFSIPLTPIGRVLLHAPGTVWLIQDNGTRHQLPAKGYDHFAGS
jgi:thiamine-monophosphate kinase